VQLVTDILADLFLLLSPLRVLVYLQDKGLRRKLMIIFSTCLVTTVVSLVHAAFILTTGGIKVIISALVEDCISLIVCNLPVAVTALIRTVEDYVAPPTIMTDPILFAARKLGLSRGTESTTMESTIYTLNRSENDATIQLPLDSLRKTEDYISKPGDTAYGTHSIRSTHSKGLSKAPWNTLEC